MEVSSIVGSFDNPIKVLLKSERHSPNKSYVRFHNLTERVVDIIWVNFSGDYVCYECLGSGQYIDINTFKNHPWIAYDNITKDRMHLNKKFVYEPQTHQEYFAEHYPNIRMENMREIRILVRITLPVHSLRFASLLSLKDMFKEPHEVEMLDLPRSLMEDLKNVIKYRNNCKSLVLGRLSLGFERYGDREKTQPTDVSVQECENTPNRKHSVIPPASHLMTNSELI